MKSIKIYIPTLGREGKQITLSKIPKQWRDRVFLVAPKKEKHDWKNRIDVPKDCIGNISKTRQWILESSDADFVGFLDDDIIFFNRIKNRNKLVKNEIEDNNRMFRLFYKWLNEGIDYCGMIHRFRCNTAPAIKHYGKPAHCYFMNKEFFIKNNIRFDDIEYYSDFHMPISVLEAGGKLKYSGLYIANEWKPNAPGGCSINRTAELNKKSVFRLRDLHPNYITIKDCPGHKNQNLVIDVKMIISWKKLYEDSLNKNKLDFSKMTYGCELEIADCDTTIKLPKGKWDYRDGSIANSDGFANDPKKEITKYGGEINTDPTETILEQLKQIREIYKALKNYSFNHTTNLHIHIRIPNLSSNLEMVKKLQMYVFRYSKMLLEKIEPIPEADRKYKGEDFELAKRRERRRKKSHHWTLSEKTINRIMKATNMKEFFDFHYPVSKNGKINYAGATRPAINLLQLKETDTIEFRHFTCSDNLLELCHSFLFCKKFIIEGLTTQRNPLELLKEKKYSFTKFWEFDPEIERIFLLTNVLYNKRNVAIENIKKIKKG